MFGGTRHKRSLAALVKGPRHGHRFRFASYLLSDDFHDAIFALTSCFRW